MCHGKKTQLSFFTRHGIEHAVTGSVKETFHKA